MEFGLTQESSLEFEESDVLTNLSQKLKKYFSSRSYGESIKSFMIGIICVKPEFESFFKVRKPKYVESKVEVHNGILVEVKNCYSYDIKLDYTTMTNLSREAVERLLASEIIMSLTYIDALPKKIKDFDKERFKSDMKDYFEEQDLI